MYDLLNTQPCLSRQKEHLQLPGRHLLHTGARLFRVLCVKYRVLLALAETLGSRGGSEHCRRCAAFNSFGNRGPKFGWCQFLHGNLKKNSFTFPTLGSRFNTLLCPCYCLAFCCGGKTGHDKKNPMSPSVFRAPTTVSSGGW